MMTKIKDCEKSHLNRALHRPLIELNGLSNCVLLDESPARIWCVHTNSYR